MSGTGRYIPRKANASIVEGALPEEFSQYVTKEPNEIRVEADLKARKEQAERAAIAAATRTKKLVKKSVRATIASDKVSRTDRLEGAITYIESEALKGSKGEGPKGDLKNTLVELKDKFNTKIRAAPNKLLGVFADQQKAAEENPGQYALEETSLGTEVYMPSTRTGFYKFIQDTYASRFTIKRTLKEMVTGGFT